VDTVTPYEILIAQKVEQTPVPDMADSIWAAIEQQLDAGAPDGPDGGDNTSSPKPPGKGMPGAGKLLYVLVPAAIIIATAWYFAGNKKTPTNKAEQITPVIPAKTTISAQDSVQQSSTPFKKNNPPLLLQPDNKTLPNTADAPGILPYNRPDSLQTIFFPGKQPDTASVKNNAPVIIPPDTATVSPPQKKPKGVKGITDSDYKIITTDKDSGKKKN
jgi:hypothetical protein